MINIIFKKPYKSLSVKLSLFLILLLTTSSSLWSDSFFQASDSSVEVTSESEAMMKGDDYTFWKDVQVNRTLAKLSFINCFTLLLALKIP